jgi:DNA/RNA-binding domain of Phe-tRNA-synthetase-like protein
MNINIHDNIKEIAPGCRLGCMFIQDVVIKGTPAMLTKQFVELQTQIAKAYDLEILAKVPRIAAVRNMYRRLHFDPARYRPASEALVRRVLQKKTLHFVNSAVDVNNYCSLKHLLPFGLYDADRVEGDVVYRLAMQGLYINIAGIETFTEGKPFLVDDCGVFGNPTSDSRRTAVTLATRTLLSVVYADSEITETELAETLVFTGEMLTSFNGGSVVEKYIVTA